MESYFQQVSASWSPGSWAGAWARVEYATGELKHISDYVPGALGMMAAAGDIESKCESPIEVELGARLLSTLWLLNNDRLRLFPQYLIEPFRYDFGIVLGERLIALIECDGKDFHSTRDQQRNDRVKEKVAAELSVRFFRLSGARIFEDSKECARFILNGILKRNDLTPTQWEILHEALKPRPMYTEAED